MISIHIFSADFSDHQSFIFSSVFDNNFGKVISIDVPTGLCPDNGEPFSGNAVKADFTLVIGLNKIGLIQDAALPFVGDLIHIDIGFTKNQINQSGLFTLSEKGIFDLITSWENSKIQNIHLSLSLIV